MICVNFGLHWAQSSQLGWKRTIPVALRLNDNILHFLSPSGADLGEVGDSTNPNRMFWTFLISRSVPEFLV